MTAAFPRSGQVCRVPCGKASYGLIAFADQFEDPPATDSPGVDETLLPVDANAVQPVPLAGGGHAGRTP